MAIITTFGAPTSFDGLIGYLESGRPVPMERVILGGRDFGEWTVSESCVVGDTVFFLCSEEPVKAIRRMFGEMEGIDDPEIITYIKREFILHKCYAGTIMAVGEVASNPVKVPPEREYEGMPGCWHANVTNFHRLKNPMSVSDLGDIFALNQTSSVTDLDAEQSAKLLAKVMFGNLR